MDKIIVDGEPRIILPMDDEDDSDGKGKGNKLAKLRRHASRVHFAKIHFGKNT